MALTKNRITGASVALQNPQQGPIVRNDLRREARPSKQKLIEIIRIQTEIASLGGDEFSVLLNPIEGQEGLIAAGKRLRAALIAPFSFEGHPFTLQASVGHTRVPEDGFELEALIEIADQRMYDQKRQRHAEQARD